VIGQEEAKMNRSLGIALAGALIAAATNPAKADIVWKDSNALDEGLQILLAQGKDADLDLLIPLTACSSLTGEFSVPPSWS
jgi:hypothetical protein